MNSPYPALSLARLLSGACLLSPLPNLAAQDSTVNVAASGVVVGVVSNSATIKVLEGAQVALQGSGREVVTASDGSFRFENVPAGPARLSVSYTGLKTKEVTVEVSSSGVTRSDVGLTAEIYKLNQFVVAGEREGNALAITFQRQSIGVKNVVSSDAFGSKAGNPADLLIRLPGIDGVMAGGDLRYVRVRGMSQNLSTVTIDGNRLADAGSAGSTREFQFQSVSSDSIERMEVVKSPTPDMDGDSIGGAINLVTKTAFDGSPNRRIQASFGAAWRPFDNRETRAPRNYSISYSEVFGGKLGVSFNAAYRVAQNLINQTQQLYQQLPNTVAGPAYTYSAFYQDDQKELTRPRVGTRLDYKLSENSRFFVSAMFNKVVEHETYATAVWSTSQTLATADAQGNLSATGSILPGYTDTFTGVRGTTDSNVDARSLNAYKLVQTEHLQLGGVHRWSDIDLDYNAYRSLSKTYYPGQKTLDFIVRGVGFTINRSDEPFYPSIVQTSGPSASNLANYNENKYTVTQQAGWDAYTGSALNLKKKFSAPVPAFLKAGYRFRRQTRDLEINPLTGVYVGPDGIMGLNLATGLNDDNLAQFGLAQSQLNARHLRDFPQVPFPAFQGRDTTKLDNVIVSNPSYFKRNLATDLQGQLTGNQQFQEDISAYYLMGNVILGKADITGGVRVEQTDTDGIGALQVVTPEEKARRAAYVGTLTDAEIIRRAQAEFGSRQHRIGSVRSVLPGLHFKYVPIRRIITRLSYATNIGRPSIGQLIPSTAVNYDTQVVNSSNPSLKPQTSNNFDGAVEYYFEPAGVLSVGVFYKEIKNFIYTASGGVVSSGSDNGFGGDYAGYALTTQLNGGFAKIKGIEFNYTQQFTFLPGFLSGLSAFANYTRLNAEGNYGTGSAISLPPTSEVAGFNPQAGNVGISYIRRGVTIRGQLNYRGRYLQTYNDNLSRRVYNRSRTQFDLKTAYQINRQYGVYLDVNNVFGVPDQQTEYAPNRAGTLFALTPQLLFGINANF